MADKLTLTSFGSLQQDSSATADLNANNAAIVTAMNNTLSRDGTTPNKMSASLDMNSNRILNLSEPANTSEPLRLLDVALLNGGGTISAQAMPTGGTIDQILTKNSSTNYDSSWQDASFTVAPASITGNQIDTGTVTNSNLFNMAIGTIKGNPASASAAPQDFTITGLTTIASLDPVNDYLMTQDHLTGTLKKVSGSAIVASQTAGVSSIQSLTGTFTLGAGLTNASTVLTADPTYFPRFINGLTTSLATTTTMTVAAGSCTSDDFTTMMKLTATTKTVTTAWAVGTGNGSLDTGAIAASTWYHVYVIERPDTGVVDVLTSLSATAPAMPTNYTKKRRIGSFWSNTLSQIQPYHQFRDEFIWDTPVQDINVTGFGTSASLRTLSVPLGVVTKALFNVISINSSTNYYVYVSSPSSVDIAASLSAFQVFSTGGVRVANNTEVWTNTSSQIRSRMSDSGSGDVFEINTYGWRDPRGE